MCFYFIELNINTKYNILALPYNMKIMYNLYPKGIHYELL